MKQSTIFYIITFFLAMGLLSANAQNKADTAKAKVSPKDIIKKAPPVPYRADPARIYQISLTEEEIISTVRNAGYGIMPFLKTTKTPADQLDNVAAYYNAINNKIAAQYQEQWKADRAKFVADSIKAIAPVKK